MEPLLSKQSKYYTDMIQRIKQHVPPNVRFSSSRESKVSDNIHISIISTYIKGVFEIFNQTA